MMTKKTKAHKYIVVSLMAGSLAMSMSGAAGARPARALRITLLYTTAETTTSATVAWNTNVAADSRLQYSTSYPIPASAPTLYSATQVTYRDFPLTGLAPGTLYYYTVTSCAKRECVTASGSFDTFPSCPDVVPPVSGSWQKVFSPNVATNPIKNELLGVAAVSENDVWAVGWARDPDGPEYVKRTLIQHFDGNAWSIVPSPNWPDDTQSVLHSVSAASASDVWAVGSSHNGYFPGRTLIQHWDGAQWSIVPSPNPDDQVNELRGVAALSANDVWAVGYSLGTQSESNIDTLILHWDGVSWSEVATPPNLLGVANQLFGISAISAADIWAVGSAGGAPLSMHWNGSAWSAVPVRGHDGMSGEVLAAVSGAASNDVWAVGRGRGFFSNRSGATIRHWDGVHWTLKVCRAASGSNPPDGYEGGGPDSYFTGVSAGAANDVWTVGVVGSGPAILHWDGSAWTTITHPRAFPNSAGLNAVTALSGGSAWSAGYEIEVHPSGLVTDVRTLIDRYIP